MYYHQVLKFKVHALKVA